MGNMRLAVATQNALVQTFQELIDGGPGGGSIEIRSGSQPATANLAATGTLLATLGFSFPSAPAASIGLLSFSDIAEDPSAGLTGTSTWARVKDSSGSTVFDCDVGASGSGATIELNTASIVAGGPVRITAFTINMPSGA